MVVELRGYVELIGAHEKLKQECDAALAAAERLRGAAVQVSGVLELLQRAEQGLITRLLDEEVFLLAWLPRGTLCSVLGLPGSTPANTQAAPSIPPDVRDVFRRLLTGRSETPQGEGAGADVRPPGTVSVVEALKDAVLLCRWKWERERPQAPVTVSLIEGHSGSLDVLAGRLDLVQAFAAVLMNAAEAMPDGGTVAIEIRADASGTRSISVTDSGLGMSAAVRERCMKPFFSTKEGNLGIGLNLAGRLATRYGGRLGVIGEKEKGTSVYMTFPGPPSPGEDGLHGPPRRGPLKVLLVDDDEATRDALLAMLAKQGHKAIGVEDGAAAILLLRKQRFDVVMTDLAMPIMTGVELASAVKARYPGTPVVLVSGAGEELERRHVLPEGVDVILPKPVLSFDMALALSRAMQRVEPAAGSGDATVKT
jgi:signal transduction histidine kinase/CheY-like chemotaxis protein